jgi:hypothetical protein
LNAYLLRYYFGFAGMSDAVFLEKLHAMKPGTAKEASHG